MKLIADGGAITKNVTANSKDAIILGLNTPYVDGFKLQLYLTKDNYIVSLSKEAHQKMDEMLNVSQKTLKEILHYNIGTKIQKQQIITLPQILTIFKNYNKDLVLELTDQQNKNALFVDLVLTYIRPYASLSIYLESKNKEIISYLKASKTNQSIGAIVTNNSKSNWNEEVDFYDIEIPLLAQFDIREKVRQNKLIMIDQINKQETFDLVYQEYQDIFQSIFIITAFISIVQNAREKNERKSIDKIGFNDYDRNHQFEI